MGTVAYHQKHDVIPIRSGGGLLMLEAILHFDAVQTVTLALSQAHQPQPSKSDTC